MTTPWCYYNPNPNPEQGGGEFYSHVAIADGNRMVCTHCLEVVGLITYYAPFDVTVEDQEKGM